MSAMILRIKTDNAGTSTSVQFRLPLASTSTYDFTIDWGDLVTEVITNASAGFPNITHTYAVAGEYNVSITENVVGGFPTIYFNNGGDKLKLLELKQWGTNKWITLKDSFYGCYFLTITATDEATANTGFVTDFSYAWSSCSNLTSFPLIDTSAGTNFTFTWYYCYGLTSFPLINTSAGANFSGTWSNCYGLISFPLLNTSTGTNFSYTWTACWSLSSFPLVNTSLGANFTQAWLNCLNLTSFPLIDTSLGTNFIQTWQNCTKLVSFPLVNLRKMTDGTRCFAAGALSTQSYSDLLVDIANGVVNNVILSAGRTQYNSSASAARATLISRGWTIIDQGLYTDVVTISSITPNWGPPAGGNQIVITGSGFGATQGTVLIALVAQTIVSWSDTSITVTVSAHGEGWALIEVTSAAGDKQILPATQSYLYTSLDVAALNVTYETTRNDLLVPPDLRYGITRKSRGANVGPGTASFSCAVSVTNKTKNSPVVGSAFTILFSSSFDLSLGTVTIYYRKPGSTTEIPLTATFISGPPPQFQALVASGTNDTAGRWMFRAVATVAGAVIAFDAFSIVVKDSWNLQP